MHLLQTSLINKLVIINEIHVRVLYKKNNIFYNQIKTHRYCLCKIYLLQLFDRPSIIQAKKCNFWDIPKGKKTNYPYIDP